MDFSDDALSPMTYCSALGCLRALLVEWGQLSADQLKIYTLHSMKCTLLSFYRQCDYPDDICHLQGHHKALTSMRLYGRDDVSPCITQQVKFINTVRQGWRARTPLLRGVAFALLKSVLCISLILAGSGNSGIVPNSSRYLHRRRRLHWMLLRLNLCQPVLCTHQLRLQLIAFWRNLIQMNPSLSLWELLMRFSFAFLKLALLFMFHWKAAPLVGRRVLFILLILCLTKLDFASISLVRLFLQACINSIASHLSIDFRVLQLQLWLFAGDKNCPLDSCVDALRLHHVFVASSATDKFLHAVA